MLVLFMLVYESPNSVRLKRKLPNHGMELSYLREMDMQIYGRMLKPRVFNLQVNGTGLYYTTVQLGSPPREFHVDIDTGSDIPWVSCVSCRGCPKKTTLKIKLNYFDPGSSSTSSIISCVNHKCGSSAHSPNGVCTTENYCSFEARYLEGSMASGILVLGEAVEHDIVYSPLIPKQSLTI